MSREYSKLDIGQFRSAFAICLLASAILLCGARLWADSCDITVPATVTFTVSNVSSATTGSPNPTTASFSNGVLTSGNKLRMSVTTDAVVTSFTRPLGAGAQIAASNVSWTTSNPVNGTGSNGSLNPPAYTTVYESNVDATSGSVNQTWSLAAPGSAVYAGTHTLTVRWKFESFTP